MTGNSIRVLPQPTDALRALTECLVLSFAYLEADRVFRFVSDFPEKSAQSDRAFSSFIFDGVSDFERMKGNLASLYRYSDTYCADDGVPPIVVQNVQALKKDGRRMLHFWFGQNFGGLQFAYECISAQVRDSKVREVGGSFLYRDVVSGEPFAFHKPFGD